MPSLCYTIPQSARTRAWLHAVGSLESEKEGEEGCEKESKDVNWKRNGSWRECDAERFEEKLGKSSFFHLPAGGCTARAGKRESGRV